MSEHPVPMIYGMPVYYTRIPFVPVPFHGLMNGSLVKCIPTYAKMRLIRVSAINDNPPKTILEL